MSVAEVSPALPQTSRLLLTDAVMWHAEVLPEGLLRVRIDRQEGVAVVAGRRRRVLEEEDIFFDELGHGKHPDPLQ